LITPQDEPVRLKRLLQGVPFAGTTACPRRRKLGCDPGLPAQKDDSTLRLRYSALRSCLRGQCRLHRCGTLDGPGAERRWAPAQALFVDASYVPCGGQRLTLRGHLACALDFGPQRRDGVVAGIQRVSYYISRDSPSGLSNRATKGHPSSGPGVALRGRDRQNVGGSVQFQAGRGGPLGSGRAGACAATHQGAGVHGACDPGFSSVLGRRR